ncbi:MAG TPA: hypothetical protein VEM76_16475 [Anaeromyxobacteraceae bacterium]|nr:hypothetical protein [Anaeromyxobacteraceae bacterium]
MNIRTPFVAAGAIALLGGAAVAFLVVIDGSGSRPALVDPPPPDPDAVAAAAAVRAASHEGTPPEQPVAQGMQRPASKPPMAPAPLPPSEPIPEPKPVGWEGAPVLTAARRGGETGAGETALVRLEELKPRLSPCYEAEAETRPGATPPTTWGDGDGAQSEGSEAVFVLELESPDRGQYRIVDAPVKSRGGLADAVLSCVQSILRGSVVTAPAARPGERAVLHYSP